jgi:hypothetical protein
MLTTTIDTAIPPAWNVSVFEIQSGSGVTPPKPIFTNYKPYCYQAGNAFTTARAAQPNSIEALGWNTVEALETYLRLRIFADDLDAPGMEIYDDR